MKIISFSIIGPGEADKYLEQTLAQLPPLVDEIAVCLNNADEKTEKIVNKYANIIFKDNREWGKNQWRIKEDFLRFVVAPRQPDWILPLDADEMFDKRINRQVLEKLASSPTDISYHLWCIQLWGDDQHWRKDMSFPNVRFYKFMPELGLNFQSTALHCGLAPIYAYKFATQSNYIFKHYGLMNKTVRQTKIERYRKYDPNAIYKAREWYQGLENEKVVGEPFEENDEFYKILPETIHRKKLPTLSMKPKRKIFLFLNKRGKNVEAVGEKQKVQFEKTGFVFIQEANSTGFVAEAPILEAPVIIDEANATQTNNAGHIEFTCDCGYVAKSKAGLKAHARRHNETK